MTSSRRPKGPLPMSLENVFGYANETIAATIAGDDSAAHALDHLRGLLFVIQPGYDGLDSPKKCLLYFLSNYTYWARNRDSTIAEANAIQRLGDADALVLAEHVLRNPAAEAALGARQVLTW